MGLGMGADMSMGYGCDEGTLAFTDRERKRKRKQDR